MAEIHIDRSRTFADFVTGQKSDLIKAGFCRPHWFPKKLLPEMKKDGTPYIGNSGKPRMRRSYTVEGQTPAITLTHRTDSEGEEYWCVRIDLPDEERERREAAQRAEWRENQKRVDAANARRAELCRMAYPLVEQLRHRYPGISIGGSYLENDKDGIFGQGIEYVAELHKLKAAGLVTDAMLSPSNREKYLSDYYKGATADGDRFHLRRSLGHEETWLLDVFAHTVPKDRRRRLDVAEAKRLLKQIAVASRETK